MKNAARPFYKSNETTPGVGSALTLRPAAYFVMLACCDVAVANPHGTQVVSDKVRMHGIGTDTRVFRF